MSEETPQEVPKQAIMAAPTVVRDPAQITITADKIDEVAAWLVKARSPEAYSPFVPFTVVPNNMTVINLEEHMPHPSRIKSAPSFIDVDSFVTYYNEYKIGTSPKLFQKKDDNGLVIVSIFDYHMSAQGGEEGPFTPPLPQWGDYRAFLALQYHPDYKALLDASDTWHKQEDFALFIEEFIHLFTNPAGVEMLELAQHLKGTVNAQWQSVKRLSNSQSALEYTETIKAQSVRGEIEVPEYIEMITPLYEGFHAQEICAAFRWKINAEKKAEFSFKLMTKLREREAEEEVKKAVAEGTGDNIFSVNSFEHL